ncbi:uncharacterized protein LOC115966425 [Quercus lobata]|uniref:uncharacterized protein LOC115966425 n=1 Tax=Quercus lobata TaxID=97700 RepID=UPI00124670BD|nr:uncharacterized protein LOC115966425 [Quercus lobata]
MSRLTSLQILSIIDCPHLEKRCKKDIGEDWNKISTLPQKTLHACTHAQSFLHNLLQAQKKPPSRRTSTTCSHARRFTPSTLLPLFLHAEPPPPPHRSPVHAIPLFLHAEPPPPPHKSPEQNDFEEEEFAGAWKQTGAAVSYDPKVAECQRQILEAGEMVEEAKRSLGINVDGIEDGDAFLEKENEEIDRSGPPLELNTGSFLLHAFDGAVNVSENLFLFFFASVGL